MEWDGGTIWRIALGVFFILFGAGVAFALFRLGAVLKKLANILGDANTRVIPLLTRLETTLDGVNSEIDKVDQITGSLAGMVKTAEQTTTAIHTAVAAPIRGVSGLVIGVRNSIKSFIAARRKGY